MTRPGRRRPGRPPWATVLGAVLLGGFVVVAVAGLVRGDPLAMDHAGLLPPSAHHPFGTDHLGRDLLARTGHGAATSMTVAIGSVAAAALVALPLGLVAAAHRNRPVDTVVQRAVEVVQVVPPFILVVVLLGLLGSDERVVAGVTITPTLRLTGALALGFVPYLTRVVRSTATAELALEHVEGLHLLGVPRREILLREVVPNVVPALLVQTLLAVSIAVFAEGGLSYLGLGVPAPDPTLGNLIAEAGSQLLDDAWWYALLPGVVLVAGITGVNLVADAATDLLLGERPPPADDLLATPGAATSTAAGRRPNLSDLTEAHP